MLLISFGVRAIAPAGYMPGSIADGTLFVLCPGNTPGVSYFLGRNDTRHAHDHHDEQGAANESDTTPWESCTFAAAFTASAPAPEPTSADYPPDSIFAATLPRIQILPTHIQVVRARGPPIAAS